MRQSLLSIKLYWAPELEKERRLRMAGGLGFTFVYYFFLKKKREKKEFTFVVWFLSSSGLV